MKLFLVFNQTRHGSGHVIGRLDVKTLDIDTPSLTFVKMRRILSNFYLHFIDGVKGSQLPGAAPRSASTADSPESGYLRSDCPFIGRNEFSVVTMTRFAVYHD